MCVPWSFLSLIKIDRLRTYLRVIKTRGLRTRESTNHVKWAQNNFRRKSIFRINFQIKMWKHFFFANDLINTTLIHIQALANLDIFEEITLKIWWQYDLNFWSFSSDIHDIWPMGQMWPAKTLKFGPPIAENFVH